MEEMDMERAFDGAKMRGATSNKHVKKKIYFGGILWEKTFARPMPLSWDRATAFTVKVLLDELPGRQYAQRRTCNTPQ